MSMELQPGQKAKTDKPLLVALHGGRLSPPPVWLMRQAGRYLPEYRELRASAPSFIDFCLTPELAAEATLQPVRRFGLDAAILFSDILTVPHALGQPVRFEEGRGPVLEPIGSGVAVAQLVPERVTETLAPVYEAVRRVRAALPAQVALIGFAGAPWTVACYMAEGSGSDDFLTARRWAFADPRSFAELIRRLVEATATHLIAQAEAGAEALQLFDSWAGVLPEPELRRWSLEPMREVVRRVKSAVSDVPVILFPRGVGPMLEAYAREAGADALGLDTGVPLGWARQVLQPLLPVQGNLDPVTLAVGGEALDREVRRILTGLGDGPFVFNLGHGVLPQTPPENVARLVGLVREQAA